MDTSHLDALRLRLSRERVRLAAAKTAHESKLRRTWIRQIEKEIAAEMEHLGLDSATDATPDLTLDELCAALAQ